MGAAPEPETQDAGETDPRRLFVYNGGLLARGRIRRMLELAGWDVRLGLPGDGDWVGVWGHSPTAPRGEAVAEHRDTPVLRVEDALLRSVRPGRDGGGPPLGLFLDRRGVHFDSAQPSDLEHLLATHPLDDTALLNRARDAAEWMAHAHLSKYSGFDPDTAPPAAPYVVVIDQTRGDASISHGGASAATFREMLVFAQEEHPGAQIVIKAHPETIAGARPGHFGPDDAAPGHITLLTEPISPWRLFEGAMGVYTVSSGLGFEAIFAGHKPRVFGQPFYAGWGLTADENPVARRERRLTRAQLFAAAMILAPIWYDPFRDRLCEIEDALALFEAQTRAWREDRHGYVASGMRLWKRAPLRRTFGREGGMAFADDPARANRIAAAKGYRRMVWASKATEAHGDGWLRVEDGFLRSRGLGAELVPPCSLVSDPLGIYYDPARESLLERLIGESESLPKGQIIRAERLIARLIRDRLSKYNLARPDLPDLPEGHRILIPGQVEDDASIKRGATGEVRTNAALLRAAREANPEAVILYKPHPDVEAGLREGALTGDDAACADLVLANADPVDLIGACDEVWTITSLLGFEALIRGKPVTCLGVPFYAGWGLTRDLATVPERRRARPTLAGLAHATLIGYPRYFDPATGLPCPAEVVAEHLASGAIPSRGPLNRLLAKAQGLLAGIGPVWR